MGTADADLALHIAGLFPRPFLQLFFFHYFWTILVPGAGVDYDSLAHGSEMDSLFILNHMPRRRNNAFSLLRICHPNSGGVFSILALSPAAFMQEIGIMDSSKPASRICFWHLTIRWILFVILTFYCQVERKGIVKLLLDFYHYIIKAFYIISLFFCICLFFKLTYILSRNRVKRRLLMAALPGEGKPQEKNFGQIFSFARIALDVVATVKDRLGCCKEIQGRFGASAAAARRSSNEAACILAPGNWWDGCACR